MLLFVGCNSDETEKQDKKLNGAFEFFLSNTSDKEIQNSIIASGDLDSDGVDEYIVSHTIAEKEHYFLIKKEKNDYTNEGILKDSFLGGFTLVNAEIKNLDLISNKYIVVNTLHIKDKTKGYVIYEYSNAKISLVSVNLPNENQHADKTLEDTNNDGIYENISKYYYDDRQNHVVVEKNTFGNETIEFTLEYKNTEKTFEYPENPEEVVQSYIEAYSLINATGLEFDELNEEKLALLINKDEINKEIYFTPSIDKGNALNIDIIEASFLQNRRIYYVKDSLSDPDDLPEEYLFTLIEANNEWKIESIVSSNEPMKIGEKTSYSKNIRIDYFLYIDQLRNMPNEILEQQVHNFSNFEIYNASSNKKLYSSTQRINGIFIDSYIFDKNKNGKLEIYFTEIDRVMREYILIVEESNNTYKQIFYGPATDFIYLDFNADGKIDLLTNQPSGYNAEWWDGFEVINELNSNGVYKASESLSKFAHTNSKNKAIQEFTKRKTVTNFKKMVDSYAKLGLEDEIMDLYNNNIYFVNDNIQAIEKGEENSIGSYLEFSKYKAMRYAEYWNDRF